MSGSHSHAAHDALTLVLRLSCEPDSTHSPETLEVLARWKPALDAVLAGLSRSDAIALVVQSAGPDDSGWIPVGKKWPEFYETVLLNCDGELRSTGFLKQNGGGVGVWTIDAEDLSDGSRWVVTHWQPLPESPK